MKPGLSLPPALDGERLEHQGRAGRISYYLAGSGQPVLLLHSINAAGSAFEMRPVFEHLKRNFQVFVPDLPGFGFSERSDRKYDIALYLKSVEDMLEVISAKGHNGPTTGIALSLASEFLARAAVARPERFSRLVLISPTGFNSGSGKLRGSAMASREITGMHAAVSFPLWGRGLFSLLTSRRSIRYFLERTWGSRDIEGAMLEYDYLTTHQPGAEHAPFAFLSGRLFSRDIRDLYEKLELPVWVAHCTRGDFKDYSERHWAEAKSNWSFSEFETGALPHFESPQLFLDDLERFFAKSAADTV